MIGGFRLINGETAWHNGPVIEALERGAILLLDEVDLASNKILCLQSVLEGKGVFLKKIGKFVRPTSGFNIFATANTKGKGSEDGRFIGTNVLNEAFLERFPVTFEQSYPAPSVEQRILEGVSLDLGIEDKEFCSQLVNWADVIRKTFYDGGIEEIISTRRLDPILFVPTASSRIRQRQFRYVSIVLMPKQSKHSLNSMIRLILISNFLLTNLNQTDMIRGGKYSSSLFLCVKNYD